MKMTKTKTLCALYLCAAAIPLVASAADENAAKPSGFEFGLGAGGSKLDLSEPGTPGTISLGGGTYTAFVGYRINRWSAIEASYLDSGYVKKQNSPAYFKTEPHLVTATGMGILPLNESFALFARAGLAHWWYTAEFGITGVGLASFNEKSNQLIWGAGPSVVIDRALLRLEYGQTKTSPNLGGLPFDLKLRILTLSAVWTL
jgi:hypothetical protein